MSSYSLFMCGGFKAALTWVTASLVLSGFHGGTAHAGSKRWLLEGGGAALAPLRGKRMAT